MDLSIVSFIIFRLNQINSIGDFFTTTAPAQYQNENENEH